MGANLHMSFSAPVTRVASKPHCPLWSLDQLPHCVDTKHSGRISEIIFGNFQLGCTLLIPGLKACGGCKEHFQRAGCGGGEVGGGLARDGKKRFFSVMSLSLGAELIQGGQFV